MCTNDGSGTWAAFGGTYIWSEDFSQLEYVGQIPNSTLGSWGWGEESAGGHDPYHVPFQGNHNISCACKIGARLDKKGPVGLGTLTTCYGMENPSYRMASLVGGLWTHLLPEDGGKGHMWAPSLISQYPNLEAGKKGARISIQALSLSWLHDHMTKDIASPSVPSFPNRSHFQNQ